MYEWVSLQDQWLAGVKPPLSWVWEREVTCCLCLQDSHYLDMWTIEHGTDEATFTFCADCHLRYEDEPFRAHLEAAEWASMLDSLRKLEFG